MASRCPQCGEVAVGYANIDGVRYCHGEERPSCYERAQRRTGLIDNLIGLTDGLLESVQRELTRYNRREQQMTDNRKFTDESWGIVAVAANRAMDEDHMLLKQLKELRVEKGLSVEEVAWRCSRTEEDIREFEAHGANPTMSFIRRYALALGCFVTHELVYDFDDSLMEEGDTE